MSARRVARPMLGKFTLLASAIAALLGLRAGDVAANTYTVTSCADDGSGGTLRSQILAVPSPGMDPAPVIDMTTLQCSTITLSPSYGQINVQYAVAIYGPTSHTLDIVGAACADQYHCEYRVFNNNNLYDLAIHDLSIEGGREARDGNAYGGCIYSKGGVALHNVKLHDCTARSATASATGGAVFAEKSAGLDRTAVTGSTAASVGGGGRGGGVATRLLTLSFSTLSFNQASGPSGGFGGGAFASAAALIDSSTVSNNTGSFIGGLSQRGPYPTGALYLWNSTISSNTSTGVIGGLSTNAAIVTIANSTIAFNSAQNTGGYFITYAAGADIESPNSVTLQSSILSGNATGANEQDFYAYGGAAMSTAGGADNIVGVSQGLPAVPADTSSACPLLGPLRDNGGLTLTHALHSGSPAIDAGNNTSYSTSYDQRGSALTNGTLDYPRMSGTTDIGAYEVQKDDIVFNAGMDGCAAPL